MSRPQFEVGELDDQLGLVRPYNNATLVSSSRRYHEVMRRLSLAGLLHFARRPIAVIGILLVWKKDPTSQRLILDASRTSRRFGDPPHAELLTSEGFSHLEVLIGRRGDEGHWPPLWWLPRRAKNGSSQATP